MGKIRIIYVNGVGLVDGDIDRDMWVIGAKHVFLKKCCQCAKGRRIGIIAQEKRISLEFRIDPRLDKLFKGKVGQ